MEKNVIKMSVRNLVEFIIKSGNIDNRRSTYKEIDAMKQGTKLHKKIQNGMAINYKSEVTLKNTNSIVQEDIDFEICIEGRADGIVYPDNSESAKKSYVTIESNNYIDSTTKERLDILECGISESNNDMVFKGYIPNTEFSDIDSYYEQFNSHTFNELNNDLIDEDNSITIIDEIKCVLKSVEKIKQPVDVHRAQAMCYAYFFAKDNDIERIGIRITYCNIDTEDKKYFGEVFSFEYLKKWYNYLLLEYAKWAAYQIKWQKVRNDSIKKLEFPFEYRSGQRDIAAGVYRTIIRDKKLYIQAPTGVGKTISTVFPTVKSMGEEETEKIFYLTAKTITRTTAEDTFKLLGNKNTKIKWVTITAKDKICSMDKPQCNPIDCKCAKGHFDRVNDAVYDLINNENDISRDIIIKYAKKYNVCPFEMCLDVTLWVDVVICDYNYVFDPNVYLRRFFEMETKKNYVFLIDEAHNLIDRAREMYSAKIVKEEFLKVKNIVKPYSSRMEKAIDACNKELLSFKRECDGIEIYKELSVVDKLVMCINRLITAYNDFLNDLKDFEYTEEIMDLYFDIRHFSNMYDIIDDNYLIYTEIDNYNEFSIKLNCMNPACNLNNQIKKGRSAILFSATFLPINYYKEQLAGTDIDYEMYAESPFSKEKRLIMVANDVSTKYTRRSENEYKKIAKYIVDFTSAKTGNYMVFFPSYRFMEDIIEYIDDDVLQSIVMQKNDMTEEDKEEFLNGFVDNPSSTRIGFCVLGGAFGEGIDLKSNRLIGVIVVGTGLPMVCNEREIFRGYYDDINSNGFNYAYLYNGMNKVLQAAGRVIRTYDDVGAILLLDERFLTSSYQQLFPREWYPFTVVNKNNIKNEIMKFWNGEKDV